MTDWNQRMPQPKGLEKQMVDKLRTIWNNDEFIFGNRLVIKTDDERREVIEAIESGRITTPSDMVLYANQICEDRGDDPYG